MKNITIPLSTKKALFDHYLQEVNPIYACMYSEQVDTGTLISAILGLYNDRSEAIDNEHFDVADSLMKVIEKLEKQLFEDIGQVMLYQLELMAQIVMRHQEAKYDKTMHSSFLKYRYLQKNLSDNSCSLPQYIID